MGAFSFAIVCEARADCDAARLLAERVLGDEIDWYTSGICQWRGVEPQDPFLIWTRVRDEARRSGFGGPRIFGSFDGQPGEPDAFTARLALMLFVAVKHPPDAVFLIRDLDNAPRRRRGLEQAAGAAAWPFTVVVGVANPKRECWILASYEARTPEEQKRLKELTEEIGFDPVLNAERLDSQKRGAPKDAKRVLGKLTDGSYEREMICLGELPLNRMRDRGKRVGLAAYLDEVRDKAVPLLAGSKGRQDRVHRPAQGGSLPSE